MVKESDDVTRLCHRPLHLQVLKAMQVAGIQEDYSSAGSEGPYKQLPAKKAKKRDPLPYGCLPQEILSRKVDPSVRSSDEWNNNALYNYKFRKFNPPANAEIISDKKVSKRTKKICKMLQLDPHGDFTDIVFKRCYNPPKKRRESLSSFGVDFNPEKCKVKVQPVYTNNERRWSKTSDSLNMAELLTE